MPNILDQERIPPQNLEAEMSLLGAVLLDKDAMMKIADLVDPEDFYKNIHRDIFDAMLELYAKNEPIDLLTLGNRLQERGLMEQIGGRGYLVGISNTVPTASNIEQYATIVRQKGTLRKLLSASSSITKICFDEAGNDVETILDSAEQQLYRVTQKHLRQSFIPIRSVLHDAFERIDELHKEKGKLRGIPTGFKQLDNLLAGLQKSDLVILAARPSVGKTSFAMDIARHAAVKAKVPVGIFSLEMSKEQLVDRMLCAEAGVDLWKMRTGNLSDRPDSDDFPRIGHAMGVLSDAPIYIDDVSSNNVMHIRAKARRLQAEHGLGLIIIDYLQLMEAHGNKNSDNRVQEVSEMTRNLKGIARELNVPVLALSQLSRAVEQSKPAIPKLAHLRESGCLLGDTRIMHGETGKMFTMKELAERKNQTPLPVFALDDEWRTVVRPMTSVFYSGKKQVFALQLQSGKVIRASANHPFRTCESWCRLDELKPGDAIATARHVVPVAPNGTLSSDECILLAHLIGDGCIAPRQPIHYTSDDQENLNAVAESAARLFGISPRLVKQKNWYHLYLPSPIRLARGKRHPITQWLDRMGLPLCRSYEKRIPAPIFQCRTDDLALFLRHLWATDGNISWIKQKENRKKRCAIYYATASEQLAWDIQHLLLRFGIVANKKTSRKTGYRPVYNLWIYDKESQIKFLQDIGCAGRRGRDIPAMLSALGEITAHTRADIIPSIAWKTVIRAEKNHAGLSWRDICAGLDTAYCGSTLFKSNIGRMRMYRLANICQSRILTNLSTSDVYWDTIVSITREGIEDVYDATVPGLHNFLANDMIVHNSIEQDADVVLFIYRKAADRNYRVEDIPPDERFIGEIHIAKHRNGPTGMVKVFFDEARASYRNLDTQFATPAG